MEERFPPSGRAARAGRPWVALAIGLGVKEPAATAPVFVYRSGRPWTGLDMPRWDRSRARVGGVQ